MAGELGCLVEAALALPAAMQRHRYDDVCVSDHALTMSAHEAPEAAREGAAAAVFERVHDRAQRAVVRAYGARAGDVSFSAPAVRTRRCRKADDSPRREGIAAADAQWRGERNDTVPAGATDGPLRRFSQRRAARRTGRSNQDGQEAVYEASRVGHGSPHKSAQLSLRVTDADLKIRALLSMRLFAHPDSLGGPPQPFERVELPRLR